MTIVCSARVLSALLLAAGVVFGQTTFATITITDSTGAVVPAVKVTVTNVATNIDVTTESNDAGIYTVPNLNNGEYRLKAGHSGFKEVAVENIVLQARDVRRLDIRLEVGAVSSTVEVTAGGVTLRNGDFSGLAGGVAIYDPTPGKPFPGNSIPARRLLGRRQRWPTLAQPGPQTELVRRLRGADA